MNEVTKLIVEHPLAAVAIFFALGYLACLKGIGAQYFTKKPVAGTPSALPPNAAAPAPVPMNVPGQPDHPAITVLQAGIDNGNPQAVMPAVQAMLGAPKPAA